VIFNEFFNGGHLVDYSLGFGAEMTGELIVYPIAFIIE
jgi:hypothetical protein